MFPKWQKRWATESLNIIIFPDLCHISGTSLHVCWFNPTTTGITTWPHLSADAVQREQCTGRVCLDTRTSRLTNITYLSLERVGSPRLRMWQWVPRGRKSWNCKWIAQWDQSWIVGWYRRRLRKMADSMRRIDERQAATGTIAETLWIDLLLILQVI